MKNATLQRRMLRNIVILTASIGALIVGAGYAPAVASQPDPDDAARIAESELDSFRSANPEPTPPAQSASQAEWNVYWTDMYRWWKQVPWDAVAEQWGCKAGTTEVELIEAADGAVTAQYSGFAKCDRKTDQATSGRVGRVGPRSG
ncbi:hypothetical protein [Agromyces sp. NPDC049794]|uniref:hypothetical protein n=1 Tax=unclassified Agromyces TaxID=2639701 RepID=UPI0033E22DEB